MSLKDKESELPDLPQILRQALQHIDLARQPLLLAALERLAAERYRRWANEHPHPQIRESLLACAEREEEIAQRVESLHQDAAEGQRRLLAENPELLVLNRTLFEGRPIEDQFLMQAQGERAGAAAGRAYAGAATDRATQELLVECSLLEEANAAFLQSLQ